MEDKIVGAVFGTMLGFALTYAANFWDRVTRSRRMTSALRRELGEAIADLQEKMRWVGRDVAKEGLKSADKGRIVVADGRSLYLGEREEFAASRAYWKAKYTEIVEVVSARDFAYFYAMHRALDRFEQKFREMKATFDASSGDKEKMALACFHDLEILRDQLGDNLVGGAIRKSPD